LSVSGITARNKVYDGNTAATVSTAAVSYSGLVSGDALAVSATGTFTDASVATGKTVLLSSSYSGADVGNYSITDQASTTADIAAVPVIDTTLDTTQLLTYKGVLAYTQQTPSNGGTVAITLETDPMVSINNLLLSIKIVDDGILMPKAEAVLSTLNTNHLATLDSKHLAE
jgi:hypothetical protein